MAIKTAQDADVPKRTSRTTQGDEVPKRTSPKPQKEAPTVNVKDLPPASTSAPASARYSRTVPEVAEMQKAMLKFASVASATDVTAMGGGGKQYGEQSRSIGDSTKEDKEHLGGSDAFGKFVVDTFIPKNISSGRQYLNVDLDSKQRQTGSISQVNLRGIIDSIKRIGTPGVPGEKTAADGIWGQRTNNSLNLIASLTEGMLNLAKSMNVNVQGYNEGDLKNFKSGIPSSHTELKTPAEQADKAKQLTPHIEAMTSFFENLTKSLFNNKDLRQYIDQAKPFEQYKKEISIPEDKKNQPMVGVKLDWVTNKDVSNTISLSDLQDVNSFKALVARLGLPNDDPKMVTKVLQDLYKSVERAKKEAGK